MDNSAMVSTVNQLLNTLRLNGEYSDAAGFAYRTLLVEGATDTRFLEPILHEEARCYPVMRILQARQALGAGARADFVSCKAVILELLKRLASSPTFFGFPEGSERWPLFGLVDRDFRASAALPRTPRLFVTDTHDLETTMLYTDPDIMTRIDGLGAVGEEDCRKAFFLAYQLALCKVAIFSLNGDLNTRFVDGRHGLVDYGAFTHSCLIDLSELLSLINANQNAGLPPEKLAGIRRKVVKSMKKHLTPDGLWKMSAETFSVGQREDFWQITNGHDILSALRFLCPSVAALFADSGGYAQNRAFEIALCKAYDYLKFAGTDLCRRLREAGLIREE